MAFLSLKIVIGAFAAIAIVLTGVIALVITNSFTMTAMRDIGREHAGGIVQAANAKVGSFFDQAVAHLALTQEMMPKGNWKAPTDAMREGTAQWYLPWLEHMLRLHHTFQWSYYSMIFFGFVDGNFVQTALLDTQKYFFYYSDVVSKTSNGYLRLTANDYTIMGPIVNGYPMLFTDMPLWQANPLNQLNEKIWTPPAFSSYYPGGVATIMGALHNASGVRFAKTAFAFNLTAIQSFLRTISLTANSQAFLIDGLNFVLATTHPYVPSTFLGPYNASTRYGPGCYFDSSMDGGMVCRTTAAAFPFAPLQQLASVRPAILNTSIPTTTSGAELVHLSGKNFYVSVDVMRCSVNVGLTWKLVLLMPEDDITGGVVKGRNVAIGTMAGVCFLLVACAVVFIAFMLRPLQRVSDRMYLAAELNDMEEEQSLSTLSEIALLEDSYYNLRSKLNEMKAFVPQALLHGNDCDMDLEDSTSQKLGNSANPNPAGAGASVRSAESLEKKGKGDRASVIDTASVASRGQGQAAISRGLNVASSLVRKNAAVLVVNVAGFHSAVADVAPVNALQLCETIAREVLTHVREQKGVIGVYHGDRFLVTFNAAAPAASPAKRACVAAVRVCEALKQLHRTATCGVSCGQLLCGNTGCSELKGFSCIGPACVQAVAIERLAKGFRARYGEALQTPILATGQCMTDIECDLFFQVVDYIALPDPVQVLNVVAVKSAKKEDEWMYQLHQNEAADPFALVNKGFRCLFEGDTAGAKAVITERAARSEAMPLSDEVGLTQLKGKLQHEGECTVPSDDPSHATGATVNHTVLPLTDYGAFLRYLF